MPPRRKRKVSSCEDADKNKRTRHTLKHPPPPVLHTHHPNHMPVTNNTSFSEKQCVMWFHEYVKPGEESIGPEGMEQFCKDIGVAPENIVMLVLAWKLSARQMGFFTKSEWFQGMLQLQADSIAKLRARLDYLRSLLNDPPTFKKIYRYAFDFARDKNQRSLDMETAKDMLMLLLARRWPIYNSFHQFLEQSQYKVLNKDQWCNILEFSRTIHPNLSNYDEDGAWPVLLDEFVAWMKFNAS